MTIDHKELRRVAIEACGYPIFSPDTVLALLDELAEAYRALERSTFAPEDALTWHKARLFVEAESK